MPTFAEANYQENHCDAEVVIGRENRCDAEVASCRIAVLLLRQRIVSAARRLANHCGGDEEATRPRRKLAQSVVEESDRDSNRGHRSGDAVATRLRRTNHDGGDEAATLNGRAPGHDAAAEKGRESLMKRQKQRH